jgi:hypothetical protein
MEITWSGIVNAIGPWRVGLVNYRGYSAKHPLNTDMSAHNIDLLCSRTHHPVTHRTPAVRLLLEQTWPMWQFHQHVGRRCGSCLRRWTTRTVVSIRRRVNLDCQATHVAKVQDLSVVSGEGRTENLDAGAEEKTRRSASEPGTYIVKPVRLTSGAMTSFPLTGLGGTQMSGRPDGDVTGGLLHTRASGRAR